MIKKIKDSMEKITRNLFRRVVEVELEIMNMKKKERESDERI